MLIPESKKSFTVKMLQPFLHALSVHQVISYFSLMIIFYAILHIPENMRHFYSVAAVKKGSLPDVYSIRNLRGKKACFAGVGTLAGWVIPVHVVSIFQFCNVKDKRFFLLLFTFFSLNAF